ncbi:MAG: helix-turn-helix domain-containing protein [Chloroflexota bacterium]
MPIQVNEIYYLTVREAAAMASVGHATIHRWCAAKKFPVTRSGTNRWLIVKSSFEEWLTNSGKNS